MNAAAMRANGAPASARPEDERFMRLALSLGERNLGLTWPNPSVGAVVVGDRAGEPVILATGITQPGGRPHAERIALAKAGEAARGATLYVTLEPCSARSRLDDGACCTDLVIAAGIRCLVIGAPDPSPFAHGEGYPRLAAAGVDVILGVMADVAHRAHRGHIMRVTEGRPSVFLKLACTADGYAARRSGPRLMISGEASNARTHLLRAHADAIMVAVGTVLADDPQLTVRLPGLEHRSPVRIVVDSHLRISPEARLLTTASTVPVWIIAAEDAPVEAERRLIEAGAQVMRVTATRDGRVNVHEAFRLLGARGVTRVFSEGGPGFAEALIEADLVDEFALATNCMSLDEEGIPALGPKLAASLSKDFTLRSSEDLGPDRLDIFERIR